MTQNLVAHSLRAEYQASPWVATPTPRLSWKTTAEASGWLQGRADLELTHPANDQVERAVVEGRDSVLVAWPFPALRPRDEVSVRVRVTGQDGSVSPWSEPLAIRAGFLDPGEWTASMIGTPGDTGKHPLLLRGSFDLTQSVRRATLYATAHGVYQAYVNGVQVDDEHLKPGWTSYDGRLCHETTDVTGLLRVGRNTVGLMAAGGWWTERFGFSDAAQEVYGDRIAAAALLVVETVDNETLRFTTDGSWRVLDDGPLVSSGIYAGESHDARLEVPGWADPEFDPSTWSPVLVEPGPYPRPEAQSGPPVRVTGELPVVEVIRTPSGRTVVDFGQNLVGHVRLRVQGERGQTITLRHAEVLELGELGVRPLRGAKATDRYTLAGSGEETWEPRFTFHGFRYVEVEGWPGDLDPSHLTAVVVGSDMTRTGHFECSDALLNRFHENVVWSMRGNFLSIPTDCPQRDERLGWTGDITVFSPTASFLYDCDGFLANWLQDLAIEQSHHDGVPPFVIPNVLGEVLPAAVWGDAATVVPTVVFERFGDLGLLARQWDSMTAWIERLLQVAGPRLIVTDHFQFGDWLDPDADPDHADEAKTNPDLVATAYLYRSITLTAAAADRLGHTAEAARYAAIADQVKAAFLAEFVTAAGRMMSDAPTAYALGIVFGLYANDDQLQVMGDRLAFLSRQAGYRMSAGFVGAPLMGDALTLTGHLDVAARLLFQTENPSWLYAVTMGATTIWERWDSMLEDGSINPGSMTSFNHYAFGGIADWLHRTVAGLAPAEPGYRTLAIAPRPLVGLDHASADLESPYGPAKVAWRRDGSTVSIWATVPPNTMARVTLPGSPSPFEVGSGKHTWTVALPQAEPPRPVLTTESSLAAIVDDPEAYEIVLGAFDTHLSAAEVRDFRNHTKWTPGRYLREAINRTPLPLRAEIEAGFAALNERRASGPTS